MKTIVLVALAVSVGWLTTAAHHQALQPHPTPTTPKPPISQTRVEQVKPVEQTKLEPAKPAEPIQVAPTPKPTPKPQAQPQPRPAAPVVNDPSLRLINQTRAEKGLSQLSVAGQLNQSATAKCAHMVEYDYWAHDGGGRKWSSFISGRYTSAGEILAKGWNTHEGQHNGWLNSPAHYNVIVGNFDQFGIGRCKYKDGSNLTVVHFWR